MEKSKLQGDSPSEKTEYEPTRTGLSPDTLARALRDNLYYTQGRMPEVATPHDWYAALAYTVRDRLLQRWIKTVQTLMQTGHPGGQLSFGRIPHGSAPRQRAHQSGYL